MVGAGWNNAHEKVSVSIGSNQLKSVLVMKNLSLVEQIMRRNKGRLWSREWGQPAVRQEAYGSQPSG